MNLQTITPDREQRIRKAVQCLATGTDLTWTPALPEPEAKPNDCQQNSIDKAARSGGTIQHGYNLAGREMDAYIIVSPHSVWRSPEGELIDVTPHMSLLKEMPRNVVPAIANNRGLLFVPADDAFRHSPKYLPLFPNDKRLVRACRNLSRREYQMWNDPALLEERLQHLASYY